ncbi:MAG TPA: ThuA domain-containing protein [Candidatus Sulfotelmatobacter sp.]|nr:ThuA domain-containing protein [Candidatus Sulfotelmatobacter sp.]
MKDKSRSRRDVLKLFGAAPIIAGAVAEAQTQAPEARPAPSQGASEAGGQSQAQGGRGGRGGRGRGGGFGGGDFWPGLKRLLFVADTQTGYMHDSISHAMATVEQLGRETQTYMTMIKSDSQLITDTPIKAQGRYARGGPNTLAYAHILPYYDAIFMLPSGYGTLSDQQKTDLVAFVHDQGKGLIVGHAAATCFETWPQWAEMIGASWGGEFNANATVIVEDPNFPGANAFGPLPFKFYEQHAIFVAPGYSRDSSHVVMRLDPDSLDPAIRSKKPDGDFPVAVARQYGKGRIFNVSWGHFDATWDDPRFQRMMLHGIKWAMGITPADVTPRPFPASKPTT